jgi:uncharacterized protein (DUF1697 family)
MLGRTNLIMPRFVTFLRGVTPTNAKMPALKRCFEDVGFTNVKTILSSGNVVFDARTRTESLIERKIEKAMEDTFGFSFYTIVRSAAHLQELLSLDPYSKHTLPHEAKRVVSFMRISKSPKVMLPLFSDGAHLLSVVGRELFTAYERSERGPVFMKLIEKAFGKEVTTRTWDTVKKCAAA